MFDNTLQQQTDLRWQREIARLSDVLGMQIDPDDTRLAPIRKIFPLFERMTQTDPKEMMRHADTTLDAENPAIVEAYNKGRIMATSMVLLTLIQSHLNQSHLNQ